jgi:hypothetical protein
MDTKDFQVTIDFRRARAQGYRTDDIDIASLLGAVQSALVLAGDRRISIQVRIAERDQGQLRDAVQSMCIVEDYTDLDLY